ncbi:MAG: tetratricopeptide repeat protein [Succinatimonas hippei]|nr:tetratricopeptide repeat protein [Succinatimonas hippei]
MRLTEQNVKELIIETSMKKAVFVYFYMDAPECEATTVALKKAISDDNEFIALAEANVQDKVSQAIAMQLGLQSVPALIVMQQGRPAAALQGDEIVSKLDETIKKYMPSLAELLLKEALELEEKGEIAQAKAKAKAAFAEDEKNNAAKLILARLCIKDKALDEAHTLLDNPGRELSEDQDYKDLISALTLAEQAAESPEIKELERKFKEDENNAQIAVEYAVALSDAGKKAQALEILFNILKKDLSEEKIKKTFLDMLNTMSGDPLQKEYRRKLYTIMY